MYGRKSYRREYNKGEDEGYGSGDESYADKAKRAAMKNQYIADNSGYGSGDESYADKAKRAAMKNRYITDQDKPDENPYVKPDENPYVKPDENPYVKPDENPYVKPDENPYVKPDETVVTPVLDTTPAYTPPVYTPPVYTPPVYTPPIILDEPFYVVYMTPLLILLVAIIVGIILFFVFKNKNISSADKFISAFGKLW